MQDILKDSCLQCDSILIKSMYSITLCLISLSNNVQNGGAAGETAEQETFGV